MKGFRTALMIFAGLAALLIVVAYFAGSTQVAKTGFSGLNTLALTLQGRTAKGTFAAYPGNAPKTGSGG